MTDLNSQIGDSVGMYITSTMALGVADAVTRRMNPKRGRKKKQKGFRV